MRIILFVIILLFSQSDILNSGRKYLNFQESAELFVEKLGISIDTNSLENVFEKYNNVFLSIMKYATDKNAKHQGDFIEIITDRQQGYFDNNKNAINNTLKSINPAKIPAAILYIIHFMYKNYNDHLYNPSKKLFGIDEDRSKNLVSQLDALKKYFDSGWVQKKYYSKILGIRQIANDLELSIEDEINIASQSILNKLINIIYENLTNMNLGTTTGMTLQPGFSFIKFSSNDQLKKLSDLFAKLKLATNNATDQYKIELEIKNLLNLLIKTKQIQINWIWFNRNVLPDIKISMPNFGNYFGNWKFDNSNNNSGFFSFSLFQRDFTSYLQTVKDKIKNGFLSLFSKETNIKEQIDTNYQKKKVTLGERFKDDQNIWNAMNKLIRTLENELEYNKEIGDKILGGFYLIQNKVHKLLEKSIISNLIGNKKKIDNILLEKYPNIAKEYQYAINEDISSSKSGYLKFLIDIKTNVLDPKYHELKTKIMKLGRANLSEQLQSLQMMKETIKRTEGEASKNIKSINDTINKFENEKVNKTISAKNVFLFKTLFALNNFIVMPAISQMVALKNATVDNNILQNKKQIANNVVPQIVKFIMMDILLNGVKLNIDQAPIVDPIHVAKNNINTVYQNSFANIARFLLPNLTVKNIDGIPLESVYRAFWYRWLFGINLIKTQANLFNNTKTFAIRKLKKAGKKFQIVESNIDKMEITSKILQRNADKCFLNQEIIENPTIDYMELQKDIFQSAANMIGAGFSLTEYQDSNFDNYNLVKQFDNLVTKDLIILHINNFRKIRAIKLFKEFFMPNILETAGYQSEDSNPQAEEEHIENIINTSLNEFMPNKKDSLKEYRKKGTTWGISYAAWDLTNNLRNCKSYNNILKNSWPSYEESDIREIANKTQSAMEKIRVIDTEQKSFDNIKYMKNINKQ